VPGERFVVGGAAVAFRRAGLEIVIVLSLS